MWIFEWGENANILFWTVIALVTFPIWGSILFLIQSASDFQTWLANHQLLIYIIVGIFIGIVTIVTSVISYRSYDKNANSLDSEDSFDRIVPIVLSCIGTLLNCFATFISCNIQSNTNNDYSGFFLLLHLIFYLIFSSISVGIVVFLQCASTALICESNESNKTSGAYTGSLVPLGGFLVWLLLGLIF